MKKREQSAATKKRGRREILILSLLFVFVLISYAVRDVIEHHHKTVEQVMDFSESLKLPEPKVFSLKNGLQVLHVLDKRSPSVVFMVWYHVGSADERSGKTGLAHFLEHLMFKGTEKIKPGEFANEVALQGGQLNAFTYYDYTAYYEEISADRLGKMMKLEADRMVNLRLDEKEVKSERDVVLEERRMRVDNDPFSLLYSDLTALLFKGSSYQEEVIGSFKDISDLQRQDALDFYKAYYAPNNAIIVVVGNIELSELESLTKKYFEHLKPSDTLKTLRRKRVEPTPLKENKLVERADERVHNVQLLRLWLAPSPTQAGLAQSIAIDMMARILGSGETSRLYKALVVDKKLVSNVSFGYNDSLMSAGGLTLVATALPGVSVKEIEKAVDDVLSAFVEDGPTDEEVDRAKVSIISEFIYGSDSQMSMAQLYGSALTTGLSLEDIRNAPYLTQDVRKQAVHHAGIQLLKGYTVTGILSPKGHKP